MTTSTLLSASLTETLADVKQQIRQEPADVSHRIFLFQLLSVLGQWPQAQTQLNVCKDLDPGSLAMFHMYKDAIPCEAFRSQVFAGKKTPLVFGEPLAWIANLVEALRLDGTGEHGAAQRLRDRAFEEAPATSGQLKLHDQECETSFDWIADADTRLGPILEAIINSKYYWIPWTNIQTEHIEPPTDLRDLVWMPVHFVWQNGGEMPGLIPTRYVGSDTHDNDAIRLSKRTEWISTPTGGYEGLGQRMLATNDGEFPLLELRRISLQVVSENHDG